MTRKKARPARPKTKILRDTCNMRTVPTPAGFPSEVRLYGNVYQITYGTPLWDDGEKLVGRISYDERRILIDSTLEPHAMRAVLLHEILHFYAKAKNMPTGRLLEEILDVFALAFCDIRDNNPLI